MRAILAEYERTRATTVAEGLCIEAEVPAQSNADPGAVVGVAGRHDAIIERGRTQL